MRYTRYDPHEWATSFIRYKQLQKKELLLALSFYLIAVIFLITGFVPTLLGINNALLAIPYVFFLICLAIAIESFCYGAIKMTRSNKDFKHWKHLQMLKELRHAKY